MNRATVLLVDDDVDLVRFLAERLRKDGFTVTAAHSGAEALAAVDDQWPDLVILDLMLPDIDGERVAIAIKSRADLPLIILSAVTDTDAKTALIERFAEDYLTKPFHYPELRARIERILGRLHDRIPTHELQIGPDLRLVLRRREAVVAQRTVKLTPIETRLLATLAAARGQVVSSERLLHQVWSDSDDADPVYVWVTIHRLRQKIEIDPQRPRYLHTRRGGGYWLGAGAPETG